MYLLRGELLILSILRSHLWRYRIGATIAIIGTAISIYGTLVNNLWLDPVLAREVWCISNPLFLLYFIGRDRSWWNGNHIGDRAMIVTYAVFTVSNILSFFIG